MNFLYTEILLRPLFNALVFFYNTIAFHDFGLAIIILTALIRLCFVPLSIKSLRSQKSLNKLQPQIKLLQDKFKNDKAALGQATMALYKENNVNPLSGCLPMLIQLPILLALYRALGSGFKPENFSLLYSFVYNPGSLKAISLGFIDLAHRNMIMVVLAGALQFLQLKKTMANQGTDPNSTAASMNKQMLYFMPAMIVIIGWNLPAGLVLYWLVTTAFSIFEQIYINKKYK